VRLARRLLVIAVLAGSLGLPSFFVLSALDPTGQGRLTAGALIGAAIKALIGGALVAWIGRRTVAEVATRWVALLAGRVPAALAGPRRAHLLGAAADLAAFAAAAALGLVLARRGVAAAAPSHVFLGGALILSGALFGLVPAVPRLVWAARPTAVAAPGEAPVAAGATAFAFVALAVAGLQLASGLAELVPRFFHHGRLPLRAGAWERGCVSAPGNQYCPASRRYVVVPPGDGAVRLEWRATAGRCHVAASDAGAVRLDAAADDGTFARLEVAAGRELDVILAGTDAESCWYMLRYRSAP
jgi:hypothetical protein